MVLLFLEKHIVGSIGHRAYLADIPAGPIEETTYRIEALYSRYAPKRPFSFPCSHFKFQPWNAFFIRRRCARGDFGCDDAVPNLPFWTRVMYTDSVPGVEKRRDRFSKLPTQLTG